MIRKIRVAIVGATGAVGREILNLLEGRDFPIATITLFASERSAGEVLSYKEEKILVRSLEKADFSQYDLVFFSAGGAVSQLFVPIAQKKGAIVIDNSSVFRKDPTVPLVIPEINKEAIKHHQGIIANPNCSTAIGLMALYPLHQLFKLKKVIGATYQAVSGTGNQGITELEEQLKAHIFQTSIVPKVYPHPIACNLFPHVGSFLNWGETEEELKFQEEGRRLLSLDHFKASLTCVRVPVYRSHSLALHAEFEEKPCLTRAKEALSQAQGLIFKENNAEYPTPLEAAGVGECFVGRLRQDRVLENGLALWVTGDQLLKGAALNAVQIAEVLF